MCQRFIIILNEFSFKKACFAVEGSVSINTTISMLLQGVSKKKVDPLKQPQFKLAGICCINLTALNAWNVSVRMTSCD